MQFLSGHGNFGAYLKRFGLRDSELCGRCQVVDTPEHVLYDCVEIADSRAQFWEQLMDIGCRLDLRIIIEDVVAIGLLVAWLRSIGKAREGWERMDLRGD